MSRLFAPRIELSIFSAFAVFLFGAIMGAAVDRFGHNELHRLLPPLAHKAPASDDYGGDYGSDLQYGYSLDSGEPYSYDSRGNTKSLIKAFPADKQAEVKALFKAASTHSSTELRVMILSQSACSPTNLPCGSLGNNIVEQVVESEEALLDKNDSDNVARRSAMAAEDSSRFAELSLYISALAVLAPFVVAAGRLFFRRSRVQISQTD